MRSPFTNRRMECRGACRGQGHSLHSYTHSAPVKCLWLDAGHAALDRVSQVPALGAYILVEETRGEQADRYPDDLATLKRQAEKEHRVTVSA